MEEATSPDPIFTPKQLEIVKDLVETRARQLLKEGGSEAARLPAPVTVPQAQAAPTTEQIIAAISETQYNVKAVANFVAMLIEQMNGVVRGLGRADLELKIERRPDGGLLIGKQGPPASP